MVGLPLVIGVNTALVHVWTSGNRGREPQYP
jgi:hypothetical protein